MRRLLLSLIGACFCLYAGAQGGGPPSGPSDTLSLPTGGVAPSCNLTPAYIAATNDQAHGNPPSPADLQSVGASQFFTSQTDFDNNHPTAVITCGKFRLYYEDMIQTPAGGFDGTMGAVRRNTLCAVLSYVQSVYDLKVDGVTQFIDLYIERSWLTTINPAGSNTYLAQAGPYFAASSGYGVNPGYYGGSAYLHAITNTPGYDPEVNNYDGHIIVNFDLYSYWDDYQTTTSTCKYDLYSVLLHEVTHALGFFSNVEEDPSTFAAINNHNNSFSVFDQNFLYYSPTACPSTFTKVVTGTGSSTAINSAMSSFTNPLRSNKIWLRNGPQPENHPIYSGTLDPFYALLPKSLCSHLAGNILAFTAMSQYAPGFQPNYVMGPSMCQGQRKREYTLAELRIFLTMGYSLTTTFGTSTSLGGGTLNNLQLLTTNSPAYRTNCSQPMLAYNTPFNFMETLPVDGTLTNNNPTTTSTITLNVSALSVADNEANTISVMTGSLFGIRGVSTGANNSGCLTLINSNTQIVYQPVPGFHGIAQFGFYLWDGHERGALRIVTIQVNPPTTYIVTPGNQLVVYGDLEDGTQVRQRVNNPTFEYTTIDDWAYEGAFAGHILSGGHPFNYFTNWWNIAGGDVTQDNWYACFMNVNATHGYYASAAQNWNIQGYGGFAFPNAVNYPSANDRYHHFSGGYNYSILANPVQHCNVYHFECDLNFEKTGATVGQTFTFQLQFVNNPEPALHTALYYTAPVQVTISTVTPDSWQHVSFDFQYCGTPTVYMNLLAQGITSSPPTTVLTGIGNEGGFSPPVVQPVSYGPLNSPFIDNISLKQIVSPPPFVVVASANPSTICLPGSSTLTGAGGPYLPCNATYTWTPGNSHTIPTTVSPATTTTYTLTMTATCSLTASATTTVTVYPAASISPIPASFYCSNQAAVQFTGTPAGGTWSGSSALSATGVFSPATAPLGNNTITYTPPGGCPPVSYTVTVYLGGQGPGTWPKQIGGSGRQQVTGSTIMNGGDVVIGGWASTNAQVPGYALWNSVGGEDVYAARFSEQCGTMWTHHFGGTGTDYYNDVARDAAGYIYICGSTTSSLLNFTGSISVNGPCVFMIKVDPNNGNVLAARQSTVGSGVAASHLMVDGSGNIYMTGIFSTTIKFGLQPTMTTTGGNDIWAVKYNSSLLEQWSIKLGSTSHDASGGISPAPNGNVYIAGTMGGTCTIGSTTYTNAGAGTTDIFIGRFNATTGANITGRMEGNATGNCTVRDLIMDNTNHANFTGAITGTVNLNSPALAAGTSDIYMCSWATQPVGFGNTWSQLFTGGGSTDEGKSIWIDGANNACWISGDFTGAVSLPGFTPSALNAPTGTADFLIARTTTAGAPVWCTQDYINPPTGVSQGFTITSNSSGQLYAGGNFNSACNFGTTLLTPVSTDGVVVRISPTGSMYRIADPDAEATDQTQVQSDDQHNVPINRADESGAFTLYPNPTNGELNITFDQQLPENLRLTVTDMTGRTLDVSNTQSVSGSTVKISLDGYTNGLYFITIEGDGMKLVRKVLLSK